MIPLYLSGLRNIRPKGTREITPGPVAMDVMAPMSFAPGSDLTEATDAIRDVMNAKHRERNHQPAEENTEAA